MAHGLCQNCYLTKEKIRKYRHRREGRKRGLPITLTEEEWQKILSDYHRSCIYCGRENIPLAQEHWVPVARGGGYTVDNIVPACTSCNSRKRTMTGDEFLSLLEKENVYASTHGSSCQ
jgi:5-methylcytosine-specific restriction endonuclease McrA